MWNENRTNNYTFAHKNNIYIHVYIQMAHSDLLPCLGFKVRIFGDAGNDVHFGLGAIHLSLQVPLFFDDPATVKARLLVHLPDSCIHVVLSLLELALGESPRGRRRISLNKKALYVEEKKRKERKITLKKSNGSLVLCVPDNNIRPGKFSLACYCINI